MNKKITAIILALLGSASIATIVLAQNQSPFEIPEVYIPEIYPDPVSRPNPSIIFAEGVAYDKESQESKQVMFLVMKYGERKNIYLIIEEEVYKMTELESEYLGSGTRVFKYKAGDGSILTVLLQKFERWGQLSISGDFKDYLISFKPVYYNPPIEIAPLQTGRVVEPLEPIGKMGTEIASSSMSSDTGRSAVANIRQLQTGLKKISKIEGLDIEEIQKSAKPIGEWVE